MNSQYHRKSRPLWVYLALTGTLLPHWAMADSPDELYREASGLYQQRLYTTAAQEFKKFLDANPTNPQAKLAAYQWASAVYRSENDQRGVDYAAAVKAYEWALQKYPDAPANIVAAARFELGEAYYLLEKSDKVVPVLTQFLKAPATTPEERQRAAWANYYLGKSYAELKKPTQAQAAFALVRDKYPETDAAPDSLMELGLMSLDAGQSATAVKTFTTIRQKYPTSDAAPEARVHLGEAQLAAKNYPAAREAFQGAVADAKAANFKVDALQGLADTDFAEKKWDDAAQGYAQLLQTLSANDSHRANIQLLRANSLYNGQKWADAVSAYAPLLGNSAASIGASALYYTAGALAEQGKYTDAAASYKKFLATYPTHSLAPRAALRMGDAYSDAKDVTQAAQAYKIVLTKYAKSDSAKEAQGALTDLVGSAGDSTALETALRDLPASAAGNAKLRLAQNAFERSEWTKAAQLAQAVADAKPDAATAENALYLVGNAKLNGKDAAGATVAFRKQLTAYPAGKLSSQAKLGLSWSLEDQKKWPEAEAAARTALTSTDTNVKARAQLTLAGILYSAGKYKEAVAAFAVAEKSTDKTFAAQAAQGGALALEKQNMWREASARWGKQASLTSDAEAKASALLHQGVALGKAKDAAGSQRAFDAAVAAAPKSDVAAQALYESAWAAHDAKQAGAESARWVKLETDYPESDYAAEAVFQQGEIALAAKKWDEAASQYQRMLEKWPQSDMAARANFQLGTANYNAQKWQEAAAAFDAVKEAKPSRLSLEAPFWAAESQRKAGNNAEAATRYQKFVTSLEGSATAPAALKAYLPSARLGWGQTQDDPARAAAIYQPGISAATGAVKTELGYRLGEAYTRQGKWAQAIPVLLPAATGQTGTWSAPAQWLMGQALENTGAKADAIALYKKLAALQPSNEWSEKATARLKELAS